MIVETFIKIFTNPHRYFPTIVLFWVLSQTRDILNIGILLLAFCYLIYEDKIIAFLKSKINLKPVIKALRKNRKEEALNLILKSISPKKVMDYLLYLSLILPMILLSVYTFYILITFLSNLVAVFFLIIGSLAYIIAIGKYLYQVFKRSKKIIKDELKQ